jgi:hypothetical protein
MAVFNRGRNGLDSVESLLFFCSRLKILFRRLFTPELRFKNFVCFSNTDKSVSQYVTTNKQTNSYLTDVIDPVV